MKNVPFVGCYVGCFGGIDGRCIILLVSDCTSMVLLLKLETLLLLEGEALSFIRSHLVEYQHSLVEYLKVDGCYGGCLKGIGGRYTI